MKKKYDNYLEFLKTRIESKNYKSRVSPEEYAKTLAKYKKEKLLVRFGNKKK